MATIAKNMPASIVNEKQPHLGGNRVTFNEATFFPAVWRWMVKQYDIKRVFDVGCGLGYAMDEFYAMGCEVVGLEGLWWNIDRCNRPVILQDLTQGYTILKNIDLVWCCEVVEHVEEKYLGNLLQTLSSGRVVAITHAIPGQQGWHHVNCQESPYWIQWMDRLGYSFDEEGSRKSRGMARGHWGQSGLIFTKKKGEEK